MHDFEELHNEAKKIFALNNRLKGLNNWLEKKVSHLEKEIVDLKNDFEHLEMIYNNSTDCFRNQPVEKPCENYIVLKNQVKYLIKTCARFTRGEANLEVVLGSQNCLFGKVGLGYNPSFQKKTKKFSIFFFKT